MSFIYKAALGSELVGLSALVIIGGWWAIEKDFAALAVAVIAIVVSVTGIRTTPPAFSLWLVTALVIHVVIGMAVDGYAWRYFDDALHFTIVGWLTFLAISELRLRVKRQGSTLPRPQLVAVGLLFAMGVGAIWEMFEYLVDLTGAYQAQQGLHDTMTDLFADGAGGLIACFCCFRKEESYLLPRVENTV